MIENKQTKLKVPILKNAGMLILGLLIIGFFSAATPGEPQVEQYDVDACADCHEDLGKSFIMQQHAGAQTCTACHSDAQAHMEDGGGTGNILAFKADELPNKKSKPCLSCHTKTNARYPASPHGKAAMDCSTCHVIHGAVPKPALLKTSANKSCSVCHTEVTSLFMLNERHRLQEGILSCTTCHDPHAPATRERLGGFKHESCLKCHNDKGGPYLHEHGASRMESCSSCHEVHGSPNRHMLTHQSIADLCFSCHGTAPSWHARFDSYSSNCTSCHSTIHGSNLSKIFIK